MSDQLFKTVAPLLEVDNLSVEFQTMEGVVRAVTGLSYAVKAGETIAILGESGSGKSVSAEAVLGIIDAPAGRITGGTIRFNGQELLRMSPKERSRINGEHVAMIFQDALAALNPSQTVGDQIGEMFRLHRGMGRREAFMRAIELMDKVRIPAAAQRVHAYPHEFSGGMRQRVMIASAIALDPEVLIADEPTTALDVTVQAQIMELLGELQSEGNMGLVLISHDLGVVADVADRVLVMYAGRAVEQGTLREVYRTPAHPYTAGLINSIPRLDRPSHRLQPIDGTPPSPHTTIAGCPFHPRCPWRIEICTEALPAMEQIGAHGPDRASACHRKNEVLLHV
jgi:oligopeptide transport system ATP-binding protein